MFVNPEWMLGLILIGSRPVRRGHDRHDCWVLIEFRKTLQPRNEWCDATNDIRVCVEYDYVHIHDLERRYKLQIYLSVIRSGPLHSESVILQYFRHSSAGGTMSQWYPLFGHTHSWYLYLDQQPKTVPNFTPPMFSFCETYLLRPAR